MLRGTSARVDLRHFLRGRGAALAVLAVAEVSVACWPPLDGLTGGEPAAVATAPGRPPQRTGTRSSPTRRLRTGDSRSRQG